MWIQNSAVYGWHNISYNHIDLLWYVFFVPFLVYGFWWRRRIMLASKAHAYAYWCVAPVHFPFPFASVSLYFTFILFFLSRFFLIWFRSWTQFNFRAEIFIVHVRMIMMMLSIYIYTDDLKINDLYKGSVACFTCTIMYISFTNRTARIFLTFILVFFI